MSKLFPNFWSNKIWKIEFSWKKLVRGGDTTEPTNGTLSEKVWETLF